MTVGAWLMLIVNWTFIIGLTVFCLRKVLKLRAAQARHIKPIFEIDTTDLGEEVRKITRPKKGPKKD